MDNKNKNIWITIGIIVIILIIGVIIFINRDKNDTKIDTTLFIDFSADKSDLTGISYTGNNTAIKLKQNVEIDLVYKYGNKKDYGVKWIIKDKTIAEIKDNKIIGKSSGKVEVYAVCAKNNKIKSNSIYLNFE